MKTKDDIRKVLSVSGATIANWVKTGLIPDYTSDSEGYSDCDYEEIVKRISENGRLTSRANRFHSQQARQELNTLQAGESKNILKQLLLVINEHALSNSCTMLALSLCALEQAGLITLKWKSKKTILPEIRSENIEFSVFLCEWAHQNDAEAVLGLYKALSSFQIPTDEPDFLGAVYESMRNLGEKSKLGAFFTPAFLVKDLQMPLSAQVLDPCSGTGTILLSIIDKAHPPQQITLRDIDALSLNIAKVNFALFFSRTDISVHTECADALVWADENRFDYIITNPPWGANRNPEIQTKLMQSNPAWKNLDSFAVILSQAIKRLSTKGKLVFILPESFLYVDAHSAVRKHIFDFDADVTLSYHGNAFKGVQSKVIRLELDRKKKKKINILHKGKQLALSSILLERNNYRPPAIEKAEELYLIEQLLSCPHFTLKGQCTFGLGIVTGNNKKHLLTAFLKGTEPIYTGKELEPFGFKTAVNFINFNPSILQQTAPTTLYRSPKICYRFISNKLCMVADNKGSLLLNSANFFIPSEGYNLKALAAFFNSPICTFLYQRLFGSVKVLRNHLESLPVPDAYFQYEKDLECIYDKSALGIDCREELHGLTCQMFGIGHFVL